LFALCLHRVRACVQPGKAVDSIFGGCGARLRPGGLIAQHHQGAVHRHRVQVCQPARNRSACCRLRWNRLGRARAHKQHGHCQQPGPTSPCPCHREPFSRQIMGKRAI
jgi:hypothetical protein